MSNLINIFFGKGSFRNRVDNTVPVNSGITVKRTEKGRAAYIPSTTELNSYGAINGVKTLALIVNPSGNGDILLDNGTAKLSISAGNISGTGMTECYINNVNTDTVTFGAWQIVIAEFSAGIDFATDFEIDPTTDIYLLRVIADTEILTIAEREDSYQDFLKSRTISPSPVTNRGIYTGDNPQILNISGINWNTEGVTRTAGQTIGDFVVKSGSFACFENGENDSQDEILGEEHIVNGDFSQPLAGSWIINGVPNANNYIIREDEKCTIVSDGSLIGIYQSLSASKGKTYKFSFDIEIILLGWRLQIVENAYIENRSDQGHIEFYYTSPSNTISISLIRSTLGASQFTIDNVSIKEVLSPLSKSIVCLSGGTIQFKGLDLSEFVGNGYIQRIDGDLSGFAGDTVNAANPTISFANNTVSIAMTAGQVIRNMTITKDAG